MTKRRHVLLCNDDGVFFPGIRALADAFLGAGWRVTVCAPDRERSAASHSMVLKEPIIVQKARWENVPEDAPIALWQTSGSPSDCVKLALYELMTSRPDIVVSGINNGWNAGTDCHYSGTVGAAMEGIFEGVPAIAVSVQKPNAARNACAAGYALRAAERVLATDNPLRALWNINLPDCEPEAIRGYREASMARTPYTDEYDKMPRSHGKAVYWLKGELIPSLFEKDTDLYWLHRKYATVSAFRWDWTIPNLCDFILQEEK